MRNTFPHIFPLGERSILVELEPEISPKTLEKVLNYKNVLEDHYIKEEVEVINTYNSLLINYISTIENLYNEVLVVKELLQEPKIGKKADSLLFHIPVCYDEKFGLDLRLISEVNQLEINEIIFLHSAPVYTIYFIGFLPGFLYMGGLDSKLFFPRKNIPRAEVQKGAVGIGEKQTGIYPRKSPGGWQIIGNSPISFFDKNTIPPSQFSAGDKVKFYPVSREEHQEILEQVYRGKFQLKQEKYNG